MGDNPLVSVVIATHNYAKYLPQAIDSVLAQTYKNYEIIVVDDASTDNTFDILKPYLTNKKIRYIRNQENLGEAGSRNMGNKAAFGEYIAVLDADDWWTATKLEAQMHVLLSQPQSVLCFTGAIVVSANQCETYFCDNNWVADVSSSLRYDNQIVHSSVIYKRSAVLQINGYDETLPYAVDWDLWFRLIKHYGKTALFYINNPMVYYRLHQSNMSKNINRNKQGERTVLFRALFSDAWLIKHPLAALHAIDKQYERELRRYEQSGLHNQAVYCALKRLLLSPIRSWRWRYMFNLLKHHEMSAA